MNKNHNPRKSLSFIVLLPLVIAILACSLVTGTDPLVSETQTIPLEGAEIISVALRMGAGQLTISDGSAALLDAEFIYNVDEWKPIIDYVSSGSEGSLHIEQPNVENFGLNNYRYEWALQFSEDVTYSTFDIDLGAGRSEIDLSRLAISELTLQVGAGEVELDLTGSREIDLNGDIRGGVGQLTIYLPKDIGVRVNIDGGIGSLDIAGLEKTDQGYVNDAFGSKDTIIILDIQGGVGEIELRVRD